MQWGSEGWLPGPGTDVPQLIKIPELWLCCFPPLQLAELRRWLGMKEERGSSPQQWCGLWEMIHPDTYGSVMICFSRDVPSTLPCANPILWEDFK